MKKEYRVGIIGCGKIFQRHIESIEANNDFTLVSLCDIDLGVRERLGKEHSLPTYEDFKEMIHNENLNFVVVATPNSLHYEQAKYCLENKCDILVEKPVTLNPLLARSLKDIADKNNRKAYSVLQVRLNPVVVATKKLLENNLLGKIRSISLTQRWQRPSEYFEDWRGIPSMGGGTLHECGIHYLDILCHLFGKPSALASSLYSTKHKKVKIEDTIYSLLGFESFGGTVEITIASEPSNIECSLAIMAEKGFIRLGGPSLDKFLEAKFLDNDIKLKEEYDRIVLELDNAKMPNSYGKYSGSCPNHPELYSKLEDFDIAISFDSLDLIRDIYKQSGVEYNE